MHFINSIQNGKSERKFWNLQDVGFDYADSSSTWNCSISHCHISGQWSYEDANTLPSVFTFYLHHLPIVCWAGIHYFHLIEVETEAYRG